MAKLRPWRGSGTLLLAVTCIAFLAPTATAVSLTTNFKGVQINSSAGWTFCGFYGFSYNLICTDRANLWASYQNATGCGNSSLSVVTNCLPLQGSAAACIDTMMCNSQYMVPNSALLCAVVVVSAGTAAGRGNGSTYCDISITGEYAPVTESSSSGWPVWQIVAVSVGGGLGFMMLGGCCILLYFVNVKGFSDGVAPEPGQSYDPYETTYYKVHKEHSPYPQPPAPIVPQPYFTVKPPPPVALPAIPDARGVSLPPIRGAGGNNPSWYQQQGGGSNLSAGAIPNPFTMATEHDAHRQPNYQIPPSQLACTPAHLPWPAPPKSPLYTAVPNAAPISHKLQYPPQFFLNQIPPEDQRA